jgi:hypothetical protein
LWQQVETVAVDEVLDTLVQRRRDGRAAPRMIRKLLKKEGRRQNRKFADSPLEAWREVDSNHRFRKPATAPPICVLSARCGPNGLA